MLVSEILAIYMDSIAHKSTYRSDIYVHTKLCSLWGNLEHTELTIQHLNTYKRMRLKAVRTGTVRREMSLIKRAWRYCQSEGFELTDLFDRFRMPPAQPTARRIPNQRELKALIQYTSPQVSALIRLGIETCCRRNEMLNIRRAHVDFRARTLFIPEAKTGARTIPLSKKAIRILKEWDCHFAIKPSSVSSNIRLVCNRLGIEGLCFHSITRHYGTTRLIEKGFSLPEAAAVTGHKDFKMLLVYTHLNPSRLAHRLD